MYHFEYADKVKVKEQRKELEKLLHEVQDEVRDCFTFQYHFIGSSARNMITYDPATNVGFDFDVNLEVNDNEEQYSAKKIRQTIERAFQKVYEKYGYTHFENSRKVFTVKLYDSRMSKIIHSCDIAIVNYFIDEEGIEGQKYIALHKISDSYSWQMQTKGFALKEKEDWLKHQPGAWNAVRERYLKKKNANQNPNKHSCSLYAETIKEICDQYGFEYKLYPTDEKEEWRAEGICSMREVPVINSNYCIKAPFFNTWANQM